jgi:hypothetical protein
MTSDTTAPVTVVTESSASAVSWAAILAGGVSAAAISLILLSVGAGVGFAEISPWSGAPPSTGFKITTGLYLVVMAMIASSVGGYMAGRLRSRWPGAHTREVFFRDTAHGFLAWAFATLLSAVLLTQSASALVSGAAAALSGSGSQHAGVLDHYVASLLRAEPVTRPNTGNNRELGSEVGNILASALRDSRDVSAVDRSYIAAIVSERTGLSTEEAGRRVDQTIQQAREAVDKARHAAAQLSLWLTISLLVGAFCGSLAAIEGGGLRDGTWKYQV